MVKEHFLERVAPREIASEREKEGTRNDGIQNGELPWKTSNIDGVRRPMTVPGGRAPGTPPSGLGRGFRVVGHGPTMPSTAPGKPSPSTAAAPATVHWGYLESKLSPGFRPSFLLGGPP